MQTCSLSARAPNKRQLRKTRPGLILFGPLHFFSLSACFLEPEITRHNSSVLPSSFSNPAETREVTVALAQRANSPNRRAIEDSIRIAGPENPLTYATQFTVDLQRWLSNIVDGFGGRLRRWGSDQRSHQTKSRHDCSAVRSARERSNLCRSGHSHPGHL